MLTPSNVYANRIYSEHPITIYALDDDVTYYSFIDDDKRLFDSGGWTVTNGVADDSPNLPVELPKTNSEIFSSIIGEEPTVEHSIEWTSPTIMSFEDLNQQLATFSISFYLYQSSSFVNWYEFGYVYFDEFLGADKEVVSRVNASPGSKWLNFSFTYTPLSYEDPDVRLVMRANVKSGGGPGSYNFIVHGISVGQWSENTSSQFVGVQKENAEFSLEGSRALEYGLQEDSGYYIIENNRLLGKNESTPLVYGSKNSTKILASENENSPSLIIPAKGFFNSRGKYKEYTCEFWLRINPDTDKSRRIFGPVDSDDGVYVSNNVISLSVAENFSSHPVFQWNRPMIVHVSLKSDSATLMIDGETVIDIPFNPNRSLFNSEDWLGFYSYEDIVNFDIDCVSLYSYAIAEPVAKRRFAWGQAVSSPQTVANYFQGENYYVNFSNAGYEKNIVYPDLYSWDAGSYDNLIATRSSISNPDYSLPEISVGSKTLAELYSDNNQANDEERLFFTFRPNDNWLSPSYMFFDSLDFIDRLASFYGLFYAKNTQDYSPLMTIRNIENNSVFSIYLENNRVNYKFNSEVLYFEPISIITNEEEPPEQIDTPVTFGIELSRVSQNFGNVLNGFFGSTNNLQVYIAGDEENTFDEKIYRVGFCNKKNNEQVVNLFNSQGFAKTDKSEDFYEHFATYTLAPIKRYGKYFLDISISASWEDYYPLAKLGSFTKNSNGQNYYDLDYFQINFDYPSITERISVQETPSSWTYQELFDLYNFPVRQSYEILDNSLITGYQNYSDLDNKTSTQFFLSTEKSSVKAYLTFQLLSDGANQPIENFPHTRQIVDCCFVDAEKENTSESPFKSYLTKFEVIDKAVVYPPQKINFRRVAVVVHFEIKQEGILSNPVKIRNLEIASRSFSQYQPNPIGTESGANVFPYTKRGIYFNYKEKNPVRISKTRNPYLYLSEDSGLKVLGQPTLEEEVGILIPINERRSDNASVQAMQIWVKQNFFNLPPVPYPIFEIQGLNETVEFVIRTDATTKRGVVVARDKKTKSIKEGVTFYQNGIRVKSPHLEFNEWACIGVSFDEPISFDQYVGSLNVFRGIVFNNFSYFSPEGMGKTLNVEARQWLDILNPDGEGEVAWEYWYVDDESQEIKKWVDVYVLGSKESFSITPEDIYDSFTGTNSILFDDGDSIVLENDSVAVFEKMGWSQFSLNPS
jgi:hypothetical protein